MKEKIVYVYADWINEVPVLIGKLYVEKKRGKEEFSFEFDTSWLKRDEGHIVLDPDLYFYQGRQYLPSNKPIFGMFADSCPDRWGKNLMQRREAIIARKEDRKPEALTDSDFLLGVYDETRMGAIRFSLEKNGKFLSCDKEFATPPWVTLRTLEHASLSFENSPLKEEEIWLKALIAPGSSLGGARPKATVTAPDGTLWIAKFPKKNDERNKGAWEIVVHDLANMCGLNVPEAKVETFSKRGSTFLVKRFDRENGKRIHFASAMTMLGKIDGENASYLEIADFIKMNGASPQSDLKELWKRIVFNIAVSNVDDHLRNHGFLLKKDGWHLSPAYDVNPSEYGNQLNTCITLFDSTLDFNLTIETAEYYGLSNEEAVQYIEKTKEIVDDNWRNIASSYGISRSEIEKMAPAFINAKRYIDFEQLVSSAEEQKKLNKKGEGHFKDNDLEK